MSVEEKAPVNETCDVKAVELEDYERATIRAALRLMIRHEEHDKIVSEYHKRLLDKLMELDR